MPKGPASRSRRLCSQLLPVLTALAVLPWLAPLRAMADDAKTFTVIEGASPWYDRVGNWSLTKVPDSLNGSGPIPQQSCSSRSLELPGKPKSIVLGVSVGDIAQFEGKVPRRQRDRRFDLGQERGRDGDRLQSPDSGRSAGQD